MGEEDLAAVRVPVAVALIYKIGDVRYGSRRPDAKRFGHRVLVGRRAAGMDYAGLWCVPGGKIEPNEVRGLWEYAAVRELKEETGLDVRAASLGALCAFELDAICGGKPVRLSVVAGYAQLPADAGCSRVTAPSELDALEWWSIYDCGERAAELTQVSARVILEFALKTRKEERRLELPEQCFFDALADRAAERAG